MEGGGEGGRRWGGYVEVEMVLGVGKVWVGRVYMKVGKVYGGKRRGRCMVEMGGEACPKTSLVDSTIPITCLSSNYTSNQTLSCHRLY